MDAVHTNALKLIVSLKDVVEFLSSAIETGHLSMELEKLERVKLDRDDKIRTYINCFGLVDDIHKFIQLLGNTKLDCDGHSDTYRLAYTKLVNKVRAKYIAFSKETEIIKEEIIQQLSDEIFEQIQKSNDKLAELTNLRKKYHSSHELISIYANVMQKSIDTFFSQDKTLVFKLLEFINEDKKLVLADSYQTKSKKIKTNPPQTRFGLLPATASMALTDLLTLILGQSNTTNNFTQLSKKHNCGFIILNSIVYTPVEYNIQRITDVNAAQAYIMPSDAGINKKTIERFTTLTPLKSSNKWDFSMEIHNADAGKFYILETLDGNSYRCLVPWLSTTSYSVNKFRAQKLLDYKNGEPTSALNYHALAMKSATKNMFLGRKLALDEFDTQVAQIDSGQIQNAITDAILDVANNLLNRAKIHTSTDVSDLLHDTSINATFMSAIERAFAENADNFDGGKFPAAEMMTSFITAMQTTGRRFAREIHNGYARSPLKSSEFTDSAIKNKAIAAEKIESVIRNAVELVIRRDDNLFTSSFYKYLILNYAI